MFYKKTLRDKILQEGWCSPSLRNLFCLDITSNPYLPYRCLNNDLLGRFMPKQRRKCIAADTEIAHSVCLLYILIDQPQKSMLKSMLNGIGELKLACSTWNKKRLMSVNVTATTQDCGSYILTVADLSNGSHVFSCATLMSNSNEILVLASSGCFRVGYLAVSCRQWMPNIALFNKPTSFSGTW